MGFVDNRTDKSKSKGLSLCKVKMRIYLVFLFMLCNMYTLSYLISCAFAFAQLTLNYYCLVRF